MSELHDKARAMVADPEYHGPYEHIAVIAALLAENERLAVERDLIANEVADTAKHPGMWGRMAAKAQIRARISEVARQDAEAKYRKLCEMEPVAKVWSDMGRPFVGFCYENPKRPPEGTFLIPLPTMPESGK